MLQWLVVHRHQFLQAAPDRLRFFRFPQPFQLDGKLAAIDPPADLRREDLLVVGRGGAFLGGQQFFE